MPTSRDRLPDNVLEAVQSGNVIEAIKRLREATGLGLKEAKDIIDAQLRADTHSTVPAPSGASLPPDVLASLLRGDKLEAIKLLRKQTGLGLKEAKDAVDAAEPAVVGRPYVPTDERSRAGGKVWWFVALALLGLIAYFVLRSPDGG